MSRSSKIAPLLSFGALLFVTVAWGNPRDFNRSTRAVEKRLTNAAAKDAAVYDSLELAKYGLAKNVFNLALKGWMQLRSAGKILHENILSIVDFSQPSNRKRLYVIDMTNVRLLFNTYVAHGRRSGKELATRFSNRPRSLQSSLGFYVTETTYFGSNGYSLKLEGLEGGFNNNAASREIVIHGAEYASEQYLTSNGYLGRSWGCPAVPLEQSKDIIDNIKDGSCLFIYSPLKSYLVHSKLLNKRSLG